MSSLDSIDSLQGVAHVRAALAATATSYREMVRGSSLGKNLGAGLTVAVVAIPLNLALAIASGLPPGAGLVSGAIAGVIGALLGGSRLQVTGPEVALAPICSEIVMRYGLDGLFVATFLAGLIQIGLGVVRMGRLIHVLSVPVVVGFMAAVGLLVFDAQLPRLFGLPADVRLLSDAVRAGRIDGIEPVTVGVGLLVVALVVSLPRISRRIPAALVAVVAAVALVRLLGIDVATVPSIEVVMPSVGLPRFGAVDVTAVLPEAFALATLASIDSLLCAVSVDARTGDRTRMDQELVAQGVANLACACFGGLPVAAAVVRSLTAVDAGATTRMAPLAQSVVLAIVFVALAPFVALLPLASLAGILLVVGARLVDVRSIALMWRIARYEVAVAAVTALGIVLTDFVMGVGIGVIAALAHFARQQRASAQTLENGRAVRLEGPLFFGSKDQVERAIRDAVDRDHVVIDVSGISSVDVSGAMALVKSLREVADSGTTVSILTGGRTLDPALEFFLDECRDEGISVVARVDRTSRSSYPARPSRAPIDPGLDMSRDVSLPTP